MAKLSTILGALFAVAAFTLSARASGDPPLDTANRYEIRPADIIRILFSDRSERDKNAAIARIKKISDRMGKRDSDKIKVPAGLAEKLEELLPLMGKKNAVKIITPGSGNKNPERPNDEGDQ
jgi:hypothetical protein